VTGAPIKFAGVSEKIDGLEVFDAERHAGRVLGMGDIVALVEEVQKGVDVAAARKLADKVQAPAAASTSRTSCSRSAR
jgi:signal recognition particle subunit SRP54